MSFDDNTIVKVVYIAKRAELWIDFANPLRPSYTCAVFVDVPVETVRRFKNAENREEFFNLYIRKKFRFYLTVFELCEVFRSSNWNKTANDIATYAEYQERLKRELDAKTIEATNML